MPFAHCAEQIQILMENGVSVCRVAGALDSAASGELGRAVGWMAKGCWCLPSPRVRGQGGEDQRGRHRGDPFSPRAGRRSPAGGMRGHGHRGPGQGVANWRKRPTSGAARHLLPPGGGKGRRLDLHPHCKPWPESASTQARSGISLYRALCLHPRTVVRGNSTPQPRHPRAGGGPAPAVQAVDNAAKSWIPACAGMTSGQLHAVRP